jgi:hypothetical protein
MARLRSYTFLRTMDTKWRLSFIDLHVALYKHHGNLLEQNMVNS